MRQAGEQRLTLARPPEGLAVRSSIGFAPQGLNLLTHGKDCNHSVAVALQRRINRSPKFKSGRLHVRHCASEFLREYQRVDMAFAWTIGYGPMGEHTEGFEHDVSRARTISIVARAELITTRAVMLMLSPKAQKTFDRRRQQIEFN